MNLQVYIWWPNWLETTRAHIDQDLYMLMCVFSVFEQEEYFLSYRFWNDLKRFPSSLNQALDILASFLIK